MNAAKVTLTDAERDALFIAATWVVEQGSDHEHASIYALVESVVAARIAEALRDAARRCVDNWEPVYTEGKGSEWPNDTTARWLNALADEYAPRADS